MMKSFHLPCEEWSGRLVAYAETLSPSDIATLEDHLSVCPACSLAWTEYQMLHRLLRTLPAPDFPVGLSPKLLSLWEEEDQIALNEGKRTSDREVTPSEVEGREQTRQQPLETFLSEQPSFTQEEEARSDQTLSCGVCGQAFLFTASDQSFFRQKGVQEPPKRCPSCLRSGKRLPASSDDPDGLPMKLPIKE